MQRTEQKPTESEKIEAFDEIVDIVIEGSNGPVRQGCGSRAGMIGYDIETYLLGIKAIKPGKETVLAAVAAAVEQVP